MSRQIDDERRSTEHKKELWCFWWGEMPKLLETFKELESSEKEEVWADSEQGLTYVTRTLLFKALHNAIERKLCNEGWTRMVRWFIKVPESSQNGTNTENKTRPAAISIRYTYNRF